MADIDFEELRKAIIEDFSGQIEALKIEMDAELAMVDRIEGRTRTLATEPKVSKRSHKSREPKKPGTNIGKGPSAKDRILEAQQVLNGEFTRKELHAAVTKDGRGEMKSGTFSPNMTSLLGNKIIEINKAVGSNPATYMWSEEFEKL